ncbi:hypothetical protein GJ698_26965 [Pseudoduganella sp. FT26W]|jgi:deoxyribodipyrimidine photolyase-like uncharacterized protein|uniref:DUF1640 domain-containing protein n=1 Tax=Duganella aquatilis TaxID=2666082 RepID=A0A844D6J2_9BURK|nr:hypothetical protein [Duganella aquatilis]MRW87718.1 hypothetical protein [Duganella aquatilis]
MTILFDNHQYAKRLQEAGMSAALADIQAETTGEFMNELGALNIKLDKYAVDTTAKIDQVEFKLDAKIDKVDIRLNGRIDQVEARLETKIAESRAELIRWVVGVGILQSSLLSALLLKMMPG